MVTNTNSNTVSILLGNGDGSFRTPDDYAVGSAPASVVVGDFNGDGKLDIAATVDVVSGKVSVLPGNGDGTFQRGRQFAVGEDPFYLAVGNFNRDHALDLVTANETSE